MKHAAFVFALLVIGTLANAAPVPSTFNDPNNKYSELGQAQKSCWKTHATGGDTTQARVIHADTATSTDTKVNTTARSVRAI